MSDISSVSKAMFSKGDEWVSVSDEDKIMFFFIFNRYFGKKYPEQSQLFNLKTIDKISAMNLWHQFMINKPYPKWFWSKSPSMGKKEISDSDYKFILNKLGIKNFDLDYLINNHIDFIKDELKYYKELEKSNL